MNIIVRIQKNHENRSQITNAIRIANGFQNYFFFKMEDYCLEDICAGTKIHWNTFCKQYTCNEDEYIIYITSKPFDDHWFSHEERQVAIISTYGWEETFVPPSLGSYLVYQMAQAAICFASKLSENMELNMAHDNVSACMFDICADKRDIKIGMVAGNVCPQCKAVLRQCGTDEKAIDAVENLLSYVRAEAIGKPIIFDEDSAFIIMRFTKYDENDNAYQYGIKRALENLGIKNERADKEIASAPLLEKINRQIRRCRFTIVKVDTDNLNVYFELGLAMGLDKDVLLISEENLVLELPSDLRNWECLTYTKGDYDGLRCKIEDYYKTKYHKENI